MKHIISYIRSFFWTFYLRIRGARVGKNFRIEGPMDVLLREGASFNNIMIGDNVTLQGKTYIRLRKNGKIMLADGMRAGPEVWFVGANDHELKIGKNTILGGYSVFNGGHGLTIGPYCIFAGFVYVNTSDHNFEKGKMIQEQGFSGSPISIGEDVWIGGHCFVNKGVSIGRGSVVGAGAVVTKDISSYKIAVGNPAVILKDRT